MKELTIEGIKDYKTCARLYDYRYVDKEHEALYFRKLLRDKYNRTVSRVLYFYFYKKMGGHMPSFNALMNRWEKLWFKNTDMYDVESEVIDPRVDSVVSLNTDASVVLMDFYKRWEEDEGIPLSIAANIITPINDDLYIADIMDAVIRYKKGGGHVYNVIKFYTGLNKPNIAHYLLDFANLRANFEYRNSAKLEGKDEVRYYLYDLGSERREQKMIPMNVLDEDVEDLKYWALQIDKDTVFPSRRGLTIACKNCPFDEQCRKWDDWDGENRIAAS